MRISFLWNYRMPDSGFYNTTDSGIYQMNFIMKTLIKILTALVILWGLQISTKASNHYGHMSPSQREAEAKKSLYYYNKGAVSIPRNGLSSSGIKSQSDSGNEEQTPAQDRLFFPPYVFPFWGLPYGVHSKGGFFNPGLFPFVPGGPGFPPYDGVFGSPWGPGQFPGPTNLPFNRPPPGAAVPSPTSPSESGDVSSKKLSSYYRSKPAKKYKYRKSPTPAVKVKKEKEDCECLPLSSDTDDEDDYDTSSDNRRSYYLYKKCKCKDVDAKEKEKKPPTKVVRRKLKNTGTTRSRKLAPTKKPCKYGHRSGPNGGCKAPPSRPPPVEDDSADYSEEDEDDYYQPAPQRKCKGGRCPKDNVEDEDEEEQPNYIPKVPIYIYQPVPYPVPSSNLYPSDQGQPIQVYSAPQPQSSYYEMDPSKKQSQQQIVAQQYTNVDDQPGDVGKPFMQNAFIQQYQNAAIGPSSDSPIIIQYTPIRPQPQQIESNQGDGQVMSISSGNQGTNLRYSQYQGQQFPDLEPQASTNPMIIYPQQPIQMGFPFGTGTLPISGSNGGQVQYIQMPPGNVGPQAQEMNQGQIRYIQMPPGNVGPQPQEINQGQDSWSGRSPPSFEVIYAAPTQTQPSIIRPNMNSENPDLLMNFRQPLQNQNGPFTFNSNVRSSRQTPDPIYQAVATAPPVFIDKTQNMPMDKRQFYGTNGPQPRHLYQRSSNVNSGPPQNHSSSSSSNLKDNQPLGLNNGRSSVESEEGLSTSATSAIPKFTISTIIHMHNFTGPESTLQSSSTIDPKDTRPSDQSKLLSARDFNPNDQTAVVMEKAVASRMFVGENFNLGNFTEPTLMPMVSG